MMCWPVVHISPPPCLASGSRAVFRAGALGGEVAGEGDGADGVDTGLEADVVRAGGEVDAVAADRLALGCHVHGSVRGARGLERHLDGKAFAAEYLAGEGDGFEPHTR